MQRQILKNRNKIALLSGILIAIAFLSKWTMGNMHIFEWALIIASILGAAPIAIQAYQALGKGRASMFWLQSLFCAFLIGNFEESHYLYSCSVHT